GRHAAVPGALRAMPGGGPVPQEGLNVYRPTDLATRPPAAAAAPARRAARAAPGAGAQDTAADLWVGGDEGGGSHAQARRAGRPRLMLEPGPGRRMDICPAGPRPGGPGGGQGLDRGAHSPGEKPARRRADSFGGTVDRGGPPGDAPMSARAVACDVVN